MIVNWTFYAHPSSAIDLYELVLIFQIFNLKNERYIHLETLAIAWIKVTLCFTAMPSSNDNTSQTVLIELPINIANCTQYNIEINIQL